MSSNSNVFDTLPFVAGALSGVVAWVLGYVFTYLIVAPDIRESALQRIIETFGGDSATYELVGWVFFNAHFVNTVFQNVPLVGNRTTSFIGGEQGFTVLLYVIPVGLLLAAGIALARYRGVTNATDGALTGVTALPGYLLLSVVGVFLFEVTVADVSGGPDVLPAIFLAGIIYPALVAGGGGALIGMLADT
ncbi:transporter [Haloplanus halobius]|uniref:transporter n=1 Tax=Haloplanus halobius TaxID=2934938 RepID=UPI00200C788A|nr:transporter [Haloplanus sp. XH21]